MRGSCWVSDGSTGAAGVASRVVGARRVVGEGSELGLDELGLDLAGVDHLRGELVGILLDGRDGELRGARPVPGGPGHGGQAAPAGGGIVSMIRRVSWGTGPFRFHAPATRREARRVCRMVRMPRPAAAPRASCRHGPGGTRRTLAADMANRLQAPARTYRVRTYGCQMNVHDSERLSGLLEEAGYAAAPEGDDADVVVLNTCAVRENADNRLYGNLGHLRPVKDARPGMQIAVGGCLAQKDRGEIVRRAPWVDVVFGTHNVGSLPALLERARHNAEAQVEIVESLEVFPSTLPAKRDSAYSGWVSISVGCNNTCTFCIVPSLRGTEKDRRPGDILAEVQALVDEGVLEVTLLGQNVNAYGVEFGDRGAFAKLLRAAGAHRGPGAGPVHQPAPARLHRRRHRRDGRDADGLPPAAHAAAVGLRRRAAPDAPRLPAGALPRDHRPGPRRDARRGDHHRHHRRLPRRDRGRLRADPRRRPRRRGSPAPSPSSTPSARARRPRRWTARCPRTSSRSATCG